MLTYFVLFKIWSCHFAKLIKNVALKCSFISWLLHRQIRTTIILLYPIVPPLVFYSCLAFLLQFQNMAAGAIVSGTERLRSWCSTRSFWSLAHDPSLCEGVLDFLPGSSRHMEGCRSCQALMPGLRNPRTFFYILLAKLLQDPIPGERKSTPSVEERNVYTEEGWIVRGHLGERLPQLVSVQDQKKLAFHSLLPITCDFICIYLYSA